MPPAKSLPALRDELREILTDDLAAALNALKELLPENSDKHGQALALRARLNDANRERFRNTLSPEEYLRRVDTIRAECFDLIRDLEEADFDVQGKAASAKGRSARQGSVLYRVPRRMPLRKPAVCTVRVALDEDAILEDIVLDEEVRLRQRVEVSDMMKAELLDPEGDVFAIRQLSEAEQLVRDTGFTQWLFSVTPRIEGQHQLLVKVSMMEFNANLGKYVPREVSILETVTIVTEAPAPFESEEPPFKTTGGRFALAPDVADAFAAPPAARPVTGNRSLRAVALFLVFLMVGSTATWAFTPTPIRDWWVASLKDSAEAYEHYIIKYKDSDAGPYLEKACFYKAGKTGALGDLRDYQREFPQGKFRETVLEKIKTLEISTLESISRQPDAEKIRRFVLDFPESERLPEVAAAAAARPEVMRAVQADLENAFLQKMERNPDLAKAEAFLQRFPVPIQREKFERILEQNPALKKQFLTERGKAAAVQKAGAGDRQRERQLPGERNSPENPQEGKVTEISDNQGQTNKQPITGNERQTRKSGFETVRVRGAAFAMGDDKDTDPNNCAHWVSVKTFEMGKYEVTQADWREVMGSDPPRLDNKGCDECPVEGVSWNDVQIFLKKLNEITGKNYRLPTEEEWEFAARGGLNSKGYPYAGSENVGKVAWYSDNYEAGNTFGAKKSTHPVGTKTPNELGLYDMTGNVYEWCQNKYAAYPGCPERVREGDRVVRGGAWYYVPHDCRIACRAWASPDDRNPGTGFRVAR